ncbi:MAG: DsbA family protein [Pseudomonadota bacterium]
MKRRTLVVALAIAVVLPALLSPSLAQNTQDDLDAAIHDYLVRHPDELDAIIHAYLVKNPDVLKEMFAELMKRRGLTGLGSKPGAQAAVVDHGADIIRNSALLFHSPRQVTLGNPQGDVTLVEFFDYNCGYCRRALADLIALLHDPKLKIVLKEFPILGPASGEAARVAVALRMQDSGGQKYLVFHEALLGAPGIADKDRALAAAKAAGADMARLQKDMASDEPVETLAENFQLAKALGLRGTPGYVVGERVVYGAVGTIALRRLIQAQRAGTN